MLRENFKYYFADFVRKGGTPPPFTDKIFAKKKVTDLGGTPLPPFTDKIFGKKGVAELGGTPLPPFTDFSPEIFLQKGLKIVFFGQKNT